MIPLYSRIVAFDDNEDHLQKIVWGLSKAGFCAIPFLFEDGRLEAPPLKPITGVRVVFTDIHMVGGGQNVEKVHADNIIRCLKYVVGSGPYVVVFWSQYPDDSAQIQVLIRERMVEKSLPPPIGFAAIDKNAVMRVGEGEENEEFNAEHLRALILAKLQQFKTLAVALSWEDRTARAAARTTNRLFDLVRGSANATEDWEKLLALLAYEAIGVTAREDLTAALDSALLPLLEDQLTLIGKDEPPVREDIQRLLDLVVDGERPDRPASLAVPLLNASYLIEELPATATTYSWGRGIVTELGSSFINSGEFNQAFGYDDAALIRQEFATRDLSDQEKRTVKLHVVELGPECDHVQSKISTHRYLLALLVPSDLIGAFTGQELKGKKRSTIRLRNDSVIDVGKISFEGSRDKSWHLLVSCRCFMALAAKTPVKGHPRFRLRRLTMEELAHRYATHARRPGVMRFVE
ncbi:hypothetical protein [Burkholderia ubonensis]|uniref:hypothetical protein n=1 Tax=Burkholderia ubonensis TaxID=101571 RepID=UPI000AC7815A|nr:hypothetical protein [Burkholderia ubonensis]